MKVLPLLLLTFGNLYWLTAFLGMLDNQHGGSTNAYTSAEHTNFYFDINADCLEDALDR